MGQNSNHDDVTPDAVALWDAILHDVAEQEAEDYVPSEADARWAQSVDAMMQSRIAELRRQLVPDAAPVSRGVTVPPELLKLDRAGLLVLVETLRLSKHLRYAHQELTGLTDNDLRNMLAVFYRSKQKGSR